MMSSTVATLPPIEDPLEYLSRGSIVDVSRGQVLYGEQQPASALYVLTRGRLAISVLSGSDRPVVVEICRAESFAGLPSLIHGSSYGERATALEACSAMWWTSEFIESAIQREPRLGIALIQMVAKRCARYADRLLSMAADSAEERLIRFLLLHAEDCGEPGADGWQSAPAITHEALAGCIGASREVVTTLLNRLRRQGYLTYTRKVLTLRNAELKTLLGSGSDILR